MSVRRRRQGGDVRARAWGRGWVIVFTAVPRSADSLRASFRRASGELSMTFWGWSLSATIRGSVIAFEVATGACTWYVEGGVVYEVCGEPDTRLI